MICDWMCDFKNRKPLHFVSIQSDKASRQKGQRFADKSSTKVDPCMPGLRTQVVYSTERSFLKKTLVK